MLTGKGTIRAGYGSEEKGIIKAGYGSKNLQSRIFNTASSFN